MDPSSMTKIGGCTPGLVSVVLPSFNDAGIILEYYRAITSVLEAQDRWHWELIYVDDGSSDGSQEILVTLAQSDSRVTFIELYRNFGQQRALFAGIERSKGDVVVIIDGDYQYEPETILKLAQALDAGADMASGVRTTRRDPFLARHTSRIGNSIINRILHVNLQDFGSPKAFTRGLVTRILATRHHFSTVHPTAVSLRPNTVEVPVNHRQRPIGKSKWTLGMRLKLYVDLYITYGDDHFSSIFNAGIFAFVGGIVFFVAMMAYKFLLGHASTVVDLAGIAYVVVFSGIATSAWAILMSFVIRIYKQNIHADPYVIRSVYSATVSDVGSQDERMQKSHQLFAPDHRR